jgi:putative restriction endonuclease
MRFWVGVTDNEWFRFLSRLQPDEVNFWQPSGMSFRAVKPGSPFLFKLHSPQNFIVGGGFYIRHSLLPLSMAWDAFGEKNGAPNFQTFSVQVRKYRERRGGVERDPLIGCIILAEPFFFSEDDWIPVPTDWSPNIVRGKRYDTQEPVGLSLWAKAEQRLQLHAVPPGAESVTRSLFKEEQPLYGSEYLTRARLGQGAFRVLVTEAYDRRCAITGERTLPVLEAAHIKPCSESGPHRVNNGILLRADLHILLDRGYVTLTDDLRVEVSQRIKEDFENGKTYYALHGRELEVIPHQEIERPSPAFIQWHNENRFLRN